MHYGLWCTKMRTMQMYGKSKYSQNDIVRITRKMRSEGTSDEAIIEYLGLEQPLPWMQDQEYLKPLFAFNSSMSPVESPKPYMAKKEQEARPEEKSTLKKKSFFQRQ